MPDTEVKYEVLQGIPATMLEDVWPTVWPLLQKVFDKLGVSRYYSEYDIYHFIESRDMQLWAAIVDSEVKAAFVTQFVEFPRCKVLDIVLVGGEDMESWVESSWDTFQQYALSHKAQGIRGYGRAGWTRVLKGKIEKTVIWDMQL